MSIGLVLAIQTQASAGANWIRVTSGTTSGLNGVCYGNSQYAAVGDGGIILTSSNLSSWSKPSSGTTNDLLGVSTDGSGLLVAVGTNGTVVYSSNNGVSWSKTSIAGLSNTTGCIAYGGGTFMAFFGADCYTSSNGSSWTKKATVSSNVNGLAYGDNKFWIVGNSIAAYSSDCGTSWSNWNWCCCTASALNSLVYNGATYFVSFGNSGMAYITYNNGDTYDKRTGFSSYNFKGAGYGFIDGSIFFVGVGANGGTGAIITTETTASWNDKTSEYMPAGTPVLNAVCYGTTMFVAVGESGAILVSSGVASPPVFTSGTTSSCSENSTSTGYTAAATPSNGASVTYSLSGSVDDSLFNIDSSSGVLTFKSPPNYENPGDSGGNNVYDVTVRATDSMMSADQNVAITVNNVNEAPTISSGSSASVPENQTAAYTATADDPDSGGTINWSITGGVDALLFNINSSTGAVTFKSAPDFETPGDLDHNNVYNITVRATDNGGLWDDEDIAITVSDAADPPEVVTGAAGGISASSAALSGTVNDKGGDTTVYFQYGTGMGYGTDVQATTPPGGVVSAGAGSTSVGVVLTGLSPATTYHYRLMAVNSAETVYGADATFSTMLAAPTASPGDGSTVDSGSSVTLSDATPGTTIYYTTDGTDPTTSGTKQTGTTVVITGVPGATVTIKAYAVLAGYDDSAVATFAYTIAAYTAPTLTATGGTPTFYQGGSSVDLFSSVTAATNDSGQTFSGAVLTVSNVSDSTEYLIINGTEVALTSGNSGTIAGISSYSVTMSGGTAALTLSGMSLSNSDMQVLVDGISYKNSDASVTTGTRVVTLTTITDSGMNNNSATVNIAATVAVAMQNATAPGAIILAQGVSNPVGGVVNVAIPAAGGTDAGGKVCGWINGTADTIKFTVTDSGSASSTITINGLPYTSGADYVISAASNLTIIVATSENGKATVTRTFIITVEAAPGADAPSSVVLAKGTINPVGGITNVSIPAAGGTDLTGRVIDWICGTADTIKFTVTDSGSASSTITINGLPYTSGADYTISAASDLTIIITTSESGKAPVTRTFKIPVEAAGGAAVPSSVTLDEGTINPVGGVVNVAIPAGGGTDATGAVTGWVSGTADTIKFTVIDSGGASSVISINGLPYTSGTDYIISSASTLTIIVVTSESGKIPVTRTFTITVSPPVIPTIDVGVQNGTLTSGAAGSATFAVNSADIPDGTPVVITWCDALGAPAAAPTGLSTLTPNITSNTSTITVTEDVSAIAGTYYLKAASGGAVSGVVTVTVIQPITVNDNQTVIITAPTTITVPWGVSGARIDVDTTQPLPPIKINANTSLGTVEMEIPAGTSVNGPPGWNGTISVPAIKATASSPITGAQNVDAVIEVGFGNEAITFSNAVRLLIPGMAGKAAGYVRNGVFIPITRSLSADAQTVANNEIPGGGDGKVDSGINLAIWTKHFTEFIAYTPSSAGAANGGGDNALSSYLPLVQTGPATAITSNHATLNGSILSNNGYEISSCGFLWGTSASGLTAKLEAGGNVQTGVFDANLTSLETGTTYYFQAYAVNAKGTAFGSVLSFTTPPQLPIAPAFIDIPATFWGYSAITSLSRQGIVAGYQDNTFRPDAAITRAEFAAMLIKALGLNESGNSGQFKDVPPGAWYYAAVNNAAKQGLISGTGDNLFSPEALITREQMAVMVSKALGNQAPVIDGSELDAFADKSAVSFWAVTGMEQAVRSGIIKGITPGMLAPRSDATRAQAAVMVYQLLNILK